MRFALATTVSCSFYKENCYGRRSDAGEVLRVSPSVIAPGARAWPARWPATDWALSRFEGDLVRVGDGLSLERCATGDVLLWRNRAHPTASMGACRHLGPPAHVVVDHVASKERTARRDGGHRLDSGTRLWWRRRYRSQPR